jgi:hypothetical protein
MYIYGENLFQYHYHHPRVSNHNQLVQDASIAYWCNPSLPSRG